MTYTNELNKTAYYIQKDLSRFVQVSFMLGYLTQRTNEDEDIWDLNQQTADFQEELSDLYLSLNDLSIVAINQTRLTDRKLSILKALDDNLLRLERFGKRSGKLSAWKNEPERYKLAQSKQNAEKLFNEQDYKTAQLQENIYNQFRSLLC